MALVACSIAFIMAYRGTFPVSRFCFTLIGGALLSSGALALNSYFEREWDALMPRTSHRPVPAGIIRPASAIFLGVSLALLGCIVLIGCVNLLAGMLGLAAVFLYLAVYTPAKRLTWMNTSIGAVPGAVPPLIGWAGACGQIDQGGWILFTMVFLWQHVHFLPIAWRYRDEYRKSAIPDASHARTRRATDFPPDAVGCRTTFAELNAVVRIFNDWPAYCFGSAVLAALLIAMTVRLARRPSIGAARAVMVISLFYLPVILATMVLDRCGYAQAACPAVSPLHPSSR